MINRCNANISKPAVYIHMAEKPDRIDTIVNATTAAVIGVILLCSFAIPIIVQQVGGMTGDSAQYGDLVLTVIIFLVIGLIISLIRFFNRGER